MIKKNDKNMRISFDLDEVLFVSPDTHKTEKELPFPWNRYYKERLRYGTVDLIERLHAMGAEVWVYTSSFRSEKYIRGLFRHYGVTFDGIVNAQRHLKEVQGDKKEPLPQKLPNRYHINLHIDDETVICTYGRQHGFEVFQLEAPDDQWEEKILQRVLEIQKKNQ